MRQLLLSVMAERWVEPSLERIARLIEPDTAKQLPCVYPRVMSELLAQPLNLSGEKNEPVEIALVGPDGSGRETLAAQFAATMGRPLLAVKTPLLLGMAGPDAGAARNAMVRAARWAHATGAVLYWRDAEGVFLRLERGAGDHRSDDAWGADFAGHRDSLVHLEATADVAAS